MTLLSLVQEASRRLILPVPATVIGNTSNNVIFLKAMLDKAIDDIRDEYPWPELEKEHLITLVDGDDAYALPADYDARQNETIWNRDQNWPLIGPIDAVLWQNYKSGLVTSLPRQRFRVKGWGIKQFFIDPTPSASDDTHTVAFEYISNIARRPKTWTASTVWTGFQYCSYNGVIFDRGTTAADTTGTTPPTPAGLDDGGVVWTVATSYPSFVADTDEVILDNQMVLNATIWRFKMERGLPFEELRAMSDSEIEIAKTKLSGAGIISFNRRSRLPHMIGYPYSYPEGNY